MEQQNKIAVLGGGGRTGQYIVSQLLDLGYSIKLLLRSAENLHPKNPRIEIVQGDAVSPEAVNALAEDCQAVISSIGQRKGEPPVSLATTNVLKSMSAFGIRRYIAVVGLNTDTPFDKKSAETAAATEWMRINYPVMHADSQKTYSILSSSDLNWTLVRVPWIEFKDESNEIAISLEDCRGKAITASDIARFVIEQLSDERYIRRSPFIAKR